MVNVYTVALVDDPAEMAKAAQELSKRGPSDYVILRVAEGGVNAGRADQLRQLVKGQGFIARAPLPAEREALEVGHKLLTGGGQPPDTEQPVPV
jgi:hypothetical protein